MTWALEIGVRAPAGSVIHLPSWVTGRSFDRTVCGRVAHNKLTRVGAAGQRWPLCRWCERSVKDQIEWQTELLAAYGIDL